MLQVACALQLEAKRSGKSAGAFCCGGAVVLWGGGGEGKKKGLGTEYCVRSCEASSKLGTYRSSSRYKFGGRKWGEGAEKATEVGACGCLSPRKRGVS